MRVWSSWPNEEFVRESWICWPCVDQWFPFPVNNWEKPDIWFNHHLYWQQQWVDHILHDLDSDWSSLTQFWLKVQTKRLLESNISTLIAHNVTSIKYATSDTAAVAAVTIVVYDDVEYMDKNIKQLLIEVRLSYLQQQCRKRSSEISLIKSKFFVTSNKYFAIKTCVPWSLFVAQF